MTIGTQGAVEVSGVKAANTETFYISVFICRIMY